MRRDDTCLFLAPWRDPVTRRPHPTKPSVCRYPVQWPALPNAYTPCLYPHPIYPKDCAGCRFFTKRGIAEAQPCEPTTLPFAVAPTVESAVQCGDDGDWKADAVDGSNERKDNGDAQ